MNMSAFRAVGKCNLRTFKTSLVSINHEMHEQIYTIFYLLYSQQNYSNALLCTRYASMVSNMFTCQKYNVVTGKSSVKFLKDFEKIKKISRKISRKIYRKFGASRVFPWKLPYCTQ